jgi:hypothetical protein
MDMRERVLPAGRGSDSENSGQGADTLARILPGDGYKARERKETVPDQGWT